MTNRHQDLIDDTSLAIPFVKVFFKAHLKMIKPLFKQLLFLNFIDIFINRNVISFSRLKFLNDHEFTIYKDFLLNETFSDPDIIKGLDEIKSRSINGIPLITEEKKIKIIQGIIDDEKFIKFLIEKVFLIF
ncbi:hypothetical protein CWI36_1085p0010, partial [Hamiltosporidium magnivora]